MASCSDMSFWPHLEIISAAVPQGKCELVTIYDENLKA